MQELNVILLIIDKSPDLNKENLVDKIKAEIDTKLKEENLDEQTKKNLEECFKQWKEDNFDLKKFPYGSLLQLAAKLNCAKLANALIESGIDINDGFPLHCAAQRVHVQVAEILLAAKADVNMQDQYKLTPLDHAVVLGNKIEMVKLLLKKEATNAPNQYGQTPLHYAAERGYVQIVAALLKEGDADVDVRDKNGKTPLHCATDREGEHTMAST